MEVVSMSEDGDDDRVNRLRQRRQNRETDEQSDTSESSKPSETSEPTEPEKSKEPSETDQTSVKDEMVGTYMYLPEDLKNELDLRFDELSLEHKREHGEPLEKNRDFYPAMVRAALDNQEALEEMLLHNDE